MRSAKHLYIMIVGLLILSVLQAVNVFQDLRLTQHLIETRLTQLTKQVDLVHLFVVTVSITRMKNATLRLTLLTFVPNLVSAEKALRSILLLTELQIQLFSLAAPYVVIASLTTERSVTSPRPTQCSTTVATLPGAGPDPATPVPLTALTASHVGKA